MTTHATTNTATLWRLAITASPAIVRPAQLAIGLHLVSASTLTSIRFLTKPQTRPQLMRPTKISTVKLA